MTHVVFMWPGWFRGVVRKRRVAKMGAEGGGEGVVAEAVDQVFVRLTNVCRKWQNASVHCEVVFRDESCGGGRVLSEGFMRNPHRIGFGTTDSAFRRAGLLASRSIVCSCVY